jgi:hypothetical protein
MTFWNNPSNLLPKRSFRWVISFSDEQNKILQFFAKSVDRPSYEIGVQEAKLLYSHTFRFPKRVVWKPINLVFYDTYLRKSIIKTFEEPYSLIYEQKKFPYLNSTYPSLKNYQIGSKTITSQIAPHASLPEDKSQQAFFYKFLERSGYNHPTNTGLNGNLVSDYTFKDKIIAQGSNVNKIEIKELDEDGEPIDVWSVYNPIVTATVFDKLDYSAEEILKITVTLNYDWAEFIQKTEIFTSNVTVQNQLVDKIRTAPPNSGEPAGPPVLLDFNSNTEASAAIVKEGTKGGLSEDASKRIRLGGISAVGKQTATIKSTRNPDGSDPKNPPLRIFEGASSSAEIVTTKNGKKDILKIP